MAKTETDAKKAAKKAADKSATTGTTYLAVLVDESGSMAGNQEAVVTGVNEFLSTFREQKKVRFWCGFFDSSPGSPRLRVKADCLKIKDVPELTAMDYRPRGSTPLNDSIADTITAIDKKIQPGDKAMVIFITDGLENASEMSTEDCKKLVEKYEAKEEWAFLYLGANHDAHAAAAGLGLGKAHHAMAFTSSPKGTRSSMRYAGQSASMRTNTASKSEYELLAADASLALRGVVPEDDGQDDAKNPQAKPAGSTLWTPDQQS